VGSGLFSSKQYSSKIQLFAYMVLIKIFNSKTKCKSYEIESVLKTKILQDDNKAAKRKTFVPKFFPTIPFFVSSVVLFLAQNLTL
jgi:hypothetical protein